MEAGEPIMKNFYCSVISGEEIPVCTKTWQPQPVKVHRCLASTVVVPTGKKLPDVLRTIYLRNVLEICHN
jgi:hypothetical protein